MMANQDNAPTVIRLRGIGKSYYIGTEEVPVLTHIDLDIEKGEFVSIMGLPVPGSLP